MQFTDLVGGDVIALVPRFDPVKYQRFKLVGVESGGLWVESQEITNNLLRHLGVPAAPKTLVFFLPYHEIAFAISSTEAPSLDEKAFGV